MQKLISILSIVVGMGVLSFLLWRLLIYRQQVSDRLLDGEGVDPAMNPDSIDPRQQSLVRAWLFRAGFRNPNSVLTFWAAVIGSSVTASAMLFFVWSEGYIAIASQFVSSIPGGIGNVLVPFVLAAPWFLLVVFALIPVLYVRAIRRRRVRSMEQDLPLLLDLLETLAQAGIGFDSALDRILEVQDQRRPLVSEFRIFQMDNLAGRSRVESLRRLMRRVDVPMFSTFISAIIQAEQTGAAVSATLRTQSVEMRSRRREKATAAAMSVPTLLVIPMVIGFLPGIFVILLGPMLHESLGILEQSFRGALGQ